MIKEDFNIPSYLKDAEHEFVGPVIVIKMLGRFSLYSKDGTRHAEAIYGQKTLDKYHKGSLEIWAQSTVNKRIKTMQKQISRAQEQIEEANRQLSLLGYFES